MADSNRPVSGISMPSPVGGHKSAENSRKHIFRNVEVKWRREKQAQMLPVEGIVEAVRQLLNIPGNCSMQPGT